MVPTQRGRPALLSGSLWKACLVVIIRAMKDLVLCLRDYPLVLLSALARIWAVEDPARGADEIAQQLAASMIQPDNAREVPPRRFRRPR